MNTIKRNPKTTVLGALIMLTAFFGLVIAGLAIWRCGTFEEKEDKTEALTPAPGEGPPGGGGPAAGGAQKPAPPRVGPASTPHGTEEVEHTDANGVPWKIGAECKYLDDLNKWYRGTIWMYFGKEKMITVRTGLGPRFTGEIIPADRVRMLPSGGGDERIRLKDGRNNFSRLSFCF